MQAHIVIRVPISPDTPVWEEILGQDPNDYLTFVLYDDTSEEASIIPSALKDMVASHVTTAMEEGRVRCVAEDVLR